MYKVGFIGTGVMGQGMVKNLLKAGFPVQVYTRSKQKAEILIEEGAKWCDSPAEVASTADVVITMVGYPADVEQIYFGEQGTLVNAKQGTFVIDMTTSKPSLAQRIFVEASQRGVYSLDAPVSGGDIGARNGTLSIMVGGEREAFQQMSDVFQAMGTQVIYQGAAGAGQHTKMCNQIAIASNMIGVTEALTYAKQAKLNPQTVLESITSGAAGSWSLSNLVPRMIKGDDAPGFYIKHFVKDMGIALEEMETMDINLPGLKLAKKMYDQLVELGFEDNGTQALYRWYEE
ncbi:NAD(P)-dependent oxidoreductase [Bacillus fonticola]|uniref:NAD(P)-dependent oxidoreductase n=1 Tax=Bacillus fonticola TaxID=2728853 RepID=UPI001472A9F1|nr:NAD(P)-dependent oxidoreductase [Bacillus fonticola]